jgi:hypothetical protein
MHFHKAGLLGVTELANTVHYFDSTDNEEDYNSRCQTIPNWYWKDKEIVYKFNNWGHRSKYIDELNTNNFMLAFGCSYTAGIGIREHDIWASKVAKKLKMDLYNAALGASGCDVQAYNTMHWISNKFPKPKLVVVQWPSHERKTFVEQKGTEFRGEDKANNSDMDGKWYRRRYIMDEGEMIYSNRLWYEYLNTAWAIQGVPVLNFSWESNHEKILLGHYKLWPVRCKNGSKQARDCQHDGPEWHTETAEKILGLLASYNI